MRTTSILLLLCLVIGVSGCGRNPASSTDVSTRGDDVANPVEAVPDQDEIARLYSQLDEVYARCAEFREGGEAEEAFKLYVELLESDEYVPIHGSILENYVRALLQEEAGQTSVLEVVTSYGPKLGPNEIMRVLIAIDNHGQESGDLESLAELYGGFVASRMDASTRNRIAMRLLQLEPVANESERAIAWLDLCLENFEADQSSQLLKRLLGQLQYSTDPESSRVMVLAHLESLPKLDSKIQSVILLAKISDQISIGEGDAAWGLLQQSEMLTDSDREAQARKILAIAIRSGKTALESVILERHADLESFAKLEHISHAISHGQFDEAEEALAAEISTIDPSAFNGLLSQYFTAVNASEDVERRDRVAARLVESLPADHTAQRSAAGEWLNSALDTGGNAEFLERVSKLLGKEGLLISIAAQAYIREFYDIASKEDKEDIRGLLKVGTQIAESSIDQRFLLQLANLRMDAAFMLEDYEAAIVVIDAGVPDKDETWHAAMRAKLSAHSAQRDGRPLDAVAGYRMFMEYIAEKGEAAQDPISGQSIPSGYVLGFNAKRIGDLYTQAEKLDEAAEAYAEARRHAQAAIDLKDDKSSGQKMIRELLDSLDDSE